MADGTASSEDSLVVAYDLGYVRGEFDKTLLASATQVGCGTGTSCQSGLGSVLPTRFEYFDEVEAGAGFAAEPTAWDTGDDGLGQPLLEGYESAVGMSSTVGGSGRVYVGFNPAVPSKMGSFGGSVTLDGSTTTSVVDLVDINGDNLPDKVYAAGGAVRYRLNTSRPEDPAGEPVSFSATPGTVAGLAGLPLERSVGVTGALEAHFGVSGVFSAGGSWTFGGGLLHRRQRR